MPTAKISEYEEMPIDTSGDSVPIPKEPAIAVQNITFTTNTVSAAFNSKTKFIRVVADAKAHYDIGATAAATVASPYLPADRPELFGVRQGQKIAFYDGAS